ncbi:hypothetical protein GWI33_002890 [Rhynchophorus ferrugineus]|uniref:Uncharacterized protein n=1 Tax=Rhynchophorus ferrugineus TaxID=354439 RepID=A0A834MHE8_RHYFE|nr:hypothetical protein GWI33_002890 [Rhynchophorus ferrugineus]
MFGPTGTREIPEGGDEAAVSVVVDPQGCGLLHVRGDCSPAHLITNGNYCRYEARGRPTVAERRRAGMPGVGDRGRGGWKGREGGPVLPRHGMIARDSGAVPRTSRRLKAWIF